MKVFLLTSFLCFSFLLPVWSMEVDTIPEVGKPMPYFELTHVTHYPKGRATLDDFKGKWLILDFWFTGCKACIESFPKVNRLQERFKDQIQFVMVGLNEHRFNAGIEKLYERLRDKMKLNLVSAYDSVLIVDKWKINSMPYMIIVNPEGMVYAITGGRDMDEEKLQKMLAGEQVAFYQDKPNGEPDPFDPKQNLVIQSRITRWQFGDRRNFSEHLNIHGTDAYPITCKVNRASLRHLYLFAYTGKLTIHPFLDDLFNTFYPTPILEVKDSTLFDSNYDTGKNMFNYQLYIAKENIDSLSLLTMMQKDLRRAFGFRAVIEEREMPVWKLVSKPETREKLKTKGGKRYFSGDDMSGGAAGFEARNISMQNLLSTIMGYLYDGMIPYFDYTGITENIDITIDALMMDRQQIIKELNKFGLDLILDKRKMKVLVIKD